MASSVQYHPRPAAPIKWVYAAPRQQRPASGFSGNVVSVKVEAPRMRAETPMLVDGKVPTAHGVETMKPEDFKDLWDKSLVRVVSYKFLIVFDCF